MKSIFDEIVLLCVTEQLWTTQLSFALSILQAKTCSIAICLWKYCLCGEADTYEKKFSEHIGTDVNKPQHRKHRQLR